DKGVEVKIKHSVQEIRPDDEQVVVRDMINCETKEVSYDKLLLATGAKPIVPSLTGVELDNIFTLRNVNSADQIKQFIMQNSPEQAVIVGGGYIGLEMAESLLEQNLDVTVVEMADQILTNFDSDMAAEVKEHLVEEGVEIITGDGVAEFKGRDEVEEVITSSGRKIATDFVLLSIGVRPNVELAQECGIELGTTGAIKVNSQLETSQDNIYAAGDCVESRHLITDNPVWIPLGTTANKQGRVAGSNLAGASDEFKGVLGTAITKICELTVARTGLTAKEADEAGYEYETTTIKASNHAGYYPNYSQMKIKLVINAENGVVLGGQIVGRDGVDKRIDVLATVIYNQMTADELIDLDLAYAPPYSVPKDGIMIAGLVADKERD
ncbi:MAG: FAD-dependent oxidoreductase, partial [Bacillota bacterium]